MVSIEQFFSNIGNIQHILFLFFPILGAGIKYIDAAFDEEVFNKQHAIIIAPIVGIIWAVTMSIHPTAATILLAVIFGVLLKGKIDNTAHILGFLSVIIMAIVFGIQPQFIPLIFLTAAAVLDEVGNDVTDYNKKNFYTYRFRHQFSLYFFGRRYLMKVAIIYLVIIGVFSLEIFLAFLLFDEAYIVTSIFSKSRIVLKENNDKGKTVIS